MVVLKKVKAATLVESLVSSAIILMVFMFASITFNSAFKSLVVKNSSSLENRLDEIVYFSEHQKLKMPFYEETEQWEIEWMDEPSRLVFNHKLSSKKGIRLME